MTHRSTLGLVFVLSLVGLTTAFTSPQDEGRTKPREALEKLLEERRDVLARRVDILASQHAAGTGAFYALTMGRDELLQAELEIATTKEKRLDLHRKRVANLQELQDAFTTQFEMGRVGEETLLIVTAARLRAEIDLQREQL